MAVAISAVAPPSLHSRRSRLSRVSAAAAVSSPRPRAPLFGAGDDDAARTAPLFPQGGFLALMRGQCELLSFSDDDFPPPLRSPREGGLLLPAHMSCSQQHLQSPAPAPALSLVDALNAAPVSEDDVDVLAPMFSKEEIQSLWAAHHHAPPPRLARSHSAGEKRKSSPASPPWPSCISSSDDEADSPPPPPPPVIKRARTKVGQQQKPSRRRLNWLRRRLREWHGEIAARILRRQFNPPEPSRGRTALGCRCHELALASGGGGGESCCCALHQEAREPEDRAWMYSAQGRMPLVGGPGEVLVPTLAAGNSKATVLQYARWRRGVRMPSRFYLEHAAQQQQQQGMMAPAAGRWPEDWMMLD